MAVGICSAEGPAAMMTVTNEGGVVPVYLWCVNYPAPFNHNFVNIRQAGVDLKTAIDTVGCRRWLGIGFSIAHCFVTANGSW